MHSAKGLSKFYNLIYILLYAKCEVFIILQMNCEIIFVRSFHELA